ncbi:hypothetical protein M3Y99_01827700 [Aphelenchoides fujianensis]|nr:hypothetical protein M3Y99_01827700 [Aphelenchoides fujianensis]
MASVEQHSVFECQVNGLKSIFASEQTRSSSLQRQVDEHEGEISKLNEEAAKGEGELAAVRQGSDLVKQEKQLIVEGADLTAALEEHDAAITDAGVEKLALKKKIKALRSQFADSHKNGGAPADDRMSTAMWEIHKAAFLTDFRLLVDGESIPVHRTVLAFKSAFFDSFFARSRPERSTRSRASTARSPSTWSSLLPRTSRRAGEERCRSVRDRPPLPNRLSAGRVHATPEGGPDGRQSGQSCGAVRPPRRPRTRHPCAEFCGGQRREVLPVRRRLDPVATAC